MIELVVILLVVGGSLIVFYPVLAGPSATVPAGGKASRRDAATPEADEEHEELVERKRRLFRNLKELDTERAAGRVGESDYANLRARDQAEAARVIQQIEALEAERKTGRRAGKKPDSATRAGATRQRWARAAAWVGGIAVFGAVLVFTMSRAITAREPGGTMTGTIPGDPGGAPPAGGGGGGASAMMPKANPVRLAQLERIVASDSNNLKALLEAGHLYLAEQRLDEAARVTLRALRIDSTAAEGHAHIAVLLMAEASSFDSPDSSRMVIDQAIREIDRAIRLKPGLPEAWLFKGMISMAGLQDQQAAAAAWEQYLKIAPKDADTTRIAAIVRAFKRR